MRHLKSGRQLSRNSSHRWAMMRNLITALLREEKIQTTDPKAKELRRWVDRVITLGKQGSLHARRQVLSIVQDKAVVRKLFDTIGPRFKDRPGGYTRIIKLGIRRGDAAQMALIELVGARRREGSRRRRQKTSPVTPAAAGEAGSRGLEPSENKYNLIKQPAVDLIWIPAGCFYLRLFVSLIRRKSWLGDLRSSFVQLFLMISKPGG